MTDPRFASWRDKAYKQGRFDAVVKVGGSVVYGPRLPEVARALASSVGGARLLVFPGGGEPDRLFERLFDRGLVTGPVLGELTALAQDQTGLVLAAQAPVLEPVRTVQEAERAADAGRVPVLLPSTLLATTDVFRSTNRVTSDSMAAWLAQLVGAPRILLVKSRLPSSTALSDLRGDDLVDEVFPDLVEEAGLECDVCTAAAQEAELSAWLSASPGRTSGGLSLV